MDKLSNKQTINRFIYVIIATFCFRCTCIATIQENAIQIRLNTIAEKQEYGYKTANLCELNQILQNVDLQLQLSALGCKVQVPVFYGIPSSQITTYLKQNGCEIVQEWDKILNSISLEERLCMIQNKQISERFVADLQSFREKIVGVFNNSTITCYSSLITKEFLNFIKKPSSLIVRSTGVEDKMGLTNAGGNASIKQVSPSIQEILRATGEVVASYFSAKSISQRLIMGDTTIFDLPLTPVLIQEMVTGNIRPIEGVIHTTEQAGPTPGLVSFNCGYNVVESDQCSDLYYYFYSGVGHAVLANDVEHLTENHRNAITIIAKTIEEHYQQPTDIELLVINNFDSTYVIHLVQARPLSRPNYFLQPSFVANISEVSKGNIIKANTIVAAGSYIRNISNANQIIFTKTLKDAENIYLFESPNKDDICAIVVQYEAEPNSHEATTFAGNGKLVMRIQDFEKMQEFIELRPTCDLYLDPQQGVIIKKDKMPVIITQGFITHPIPNHVSIESTHTVKPSFDIQDHFSTSDMFSIFASLKQEGEKEAKLALASLLFRMQKEIILIQQQKKIMMVSLEYITDALEKLNMLYDFTEQKAFDVLPFLQLPPNDLKRLAAIKPIEALFFQDEDPDLIRVYSLKSILEKFNRRKNLIENHLFKVFTPLVVSNTFQNLQLLDAICDGYDAAMTQDLKEHWLGLVRQLVDIDSCARLYNIVEMINDLTDLGAFSTWMHIIFANAKESQRNTLFDELYAEYKGAMPLLNHLKNLQNQMYSIRVSDWAKPEKFDSLMENLEQNILTDIISEKFLHIFNESGKLKQILALSFMSTFIDTFDDKFIKTLMSSNHYSSPEQKVKNFRKIVKVYFSILKAWEPLSTLTYDAKSWAFADFLDDVKKETPTLYGLLDIKNLTLSNFIKYAEHLPEEGFEELPQTTKDLIREKYSSMPLKPATLLFIKERFENIDSFNSYIQKLEKGIDKTDKLSKQELSVPPNFNVASEIFVNIAKTQQKIDFDGYTLAAFFTLVHQNINSILANLAIYSGLDKFKRPSLLHEIEQKIRKLGFLADESGQQKTPSLIGVKCNTASITLIYNLPLKQHGAIYDITYNHHNTEVKLIINLVSVDNNLSSIAKLFEIGAFFLKTKNIATLIYEEDLRVTCTFDNASQINDLDTFLQCIHEQTSATVKDPTQKMSGRSTAKFLSILKYAPEPIENKFKDILTEGDL